MFRRYAFITALLGIVIPNAFAHGDTIHFFVADNEIKIGLMRTTGVLEQPYRVFNATLSQSTFRTSSPGFSYDTNAFRQGDVVRLDLTSPLMEWTGTSFVTSNDTMTVSYAGGSVTSEQGPKTGFPVTLPIGDHFHATFQLNNRRQGIFLLGMSWADGARRFRSSSPFYVVFNSGRTSEEVQRATQWARRLALLNLAQPRP